MRIVSVATAVVLLLALFPAISSADSILLREGQLPLLNGVDLQGWVPVLPDREPGDDATWRVTEDGTLRCTGMNQGYLRTERTYTNYRLTLEWRWPEGAGDSGVLLHVQDKDEVWPRSIEAQLAAGKAGDFWVFKGVNFEERDDPDRMRTVKRAESSEKPIGEWNTLEVICDREQIEVRVNGVLQNRATYPSLVRGHIALQSEGQPIEFRAIMLGPLNPLAGQNPGSDKDESDAPSQDSQRGS